MRLKFLIFNFVIGIVVFPAFSVIPLIDFNNITECFRPGKEHCSPVLGRIALERGVPENIRFFCYSVSGKNSNGERNYIKDLSNDPLWEVIKDFFPSSAGTLSDTSTAISNLPKRIHLPQTIALLLEFSDQVRSHLRISHESTHKWILSGRNFHSEILSSLDLSGIKRNTRKNTKAHLRSFLTSISNAIYEEERFHFYPCYMTELIINSFFCYHFNTRKDIDDLLVALPDTIIDRVKVQRRTSLPLTPTSSVFKAPPRTIDALYAFCMLDIFVSPVPYRAGTPFISNGLAYIYNPYKQEKTKELFAECVETQGRIILNSIFKLESGDMSSSFNLRQLEEFIEKTYPDGYLPLKKLQEFYKYQSPSLANAGDKKTRSLWNEVVTTAVMQSYIDSEKHKREKTVLCRRGDFSIKGVFTNEVYSGLVNLVNLLGSITGTGILYPDFPSKGTLSDKTKWIQMSLQQMFNIINPSYYLINPVVTEGLLNQDRPDLEGKVEVNVFRDPDFKSSLFSFDIYTLLNRHGDVRNLRTLMQQMIEEPFRSVELSKKLVNLCTQKIKSLFSVIPIIKEGTSMRVLYSLLPRYLYDPVEDRSFSFFFEVFGSPLQDNQSLKNTIQTLWDRRFYIRDNPQLFPLLNQILKNMLSEFWWEDVRTITHTLVNLANIEIFKRTILDNVKELSFKFSDIEELPEIVHEFAFLNVLNLSHTKLKILTFPRLMPSLKVLNISNSTIQKIYGLENLPNLEEINYSNAKLDPEMLRTLTMQTR